MDESVLILLAAGKSRRFGSPKGLHKVAGKSWIRHQLAAFVRTGGRWVVVVLGYHKSDYLAELAFRKSSIGVVLNPFPEAGPFSSLRCGLLAANWQRLRGCYVLPIDVPWPAKGTIDEMRRLQRVKSIVKPEFRINEAESRGGHPLWMDKFTVQKLLADKVASRLDYWLQNQDPGSIGRVSVNDPRVAMNLNTIADFREMAQRNLPVEDGRSTNL
jgi:CTP:molybdopterin cytidylyltransferase MocA